MPLSRLRSPLLPPSLPSPLPLFRSPPSPLPSLPSLPPALLLAAAILRSPAVWCVSVWETLGRPPAFRLVELGPGKGTLMRDLLHAASAFPDFEQVPRRRLAAGPMHGMISTEPSGGGGRVALPPAFLYLRCVRAAAAFFITDSPPPLL